VTYVVGGLPPWREASADHRSLGEGGQRAGLAGGLKAAGYVRPAVGPAPGKSRALRRAVGHEHRARQPAAGFGRLARVEPRAHEFERVGKPLEQAGFERCEFFNLTGGIVAIHRGYKL